MKLILKDKTLEEMRKRIVEDLRNDLEQERNRRAENEAYIVEANKNKPPKIHA